MEGETHRQRQTEFKEYGEWKVSRALDKVSRELDMVSRALGSDAACM